MSSVQSPTSEEFSEYVRGFPATLRRWSYPGLGGAPVAIGGVDYRAALDNADLPAGFSDHQNAAGILAAWMLRHMDPPPGPKAWPSDNELAWSTAIEFWKLSNHLVEVEDGRRGYESKGHHVYLSYNGDINLYALGRWLDLAEGVRGSTAQAISHMHHAFHDAGKQLGLWFQKTGGTRTWFCTPDEVRNPLREAARSFLAVAPIYLPSETPTPISGSLGVITAYWCELLALGFYNYQLLQGSRPFLLPDGAPGSVAFPPSLAVGIAAFPKNQLVEHMAAAAAIPTASAEEITEFLTQDTQRIRDPALTPLVRFGDGRIFPMSSLIVPASPHRNILKILQADRERYGGLGNLFGKMGEDTVRQVLEERLAGGIRVNTNVPVRYGRHLDATDLDVVVHSPRENLLVVLEVKWHLAVDGTYESRQVEDEARKKRDTRERRRAEMRSGAANARWPTNWDVADGCDQRWFVITNDVLPTCDLADSDIAIRPYTLIKHLLHPHASARDLVALLDDPPTPIVSKRQWDTRQFGDLTVHVEMAEIPLAQSPPFTMPELTQGDNPPHDPGERHQKGPLTRALRYVAALARRGSLAPEPGTRRRILRSSRTERVVDGSR